MSVHRLRAVFLTLLAPALAGCFDPPVQERLVISFGDDARVEARAEVVFVQGAWQAAVRDRLTAVRQEHVPRVSLWSAFDSLRGTWLSPDPLVALVENEWSTPGEPLSPESLAEEPRFSRRPADWREVRAALTAHLQIAETYRARWIVRR